MAMEWPPFNLVLLNRICQAGLVDVQRKSYSVAVGGLQTVPVLLTLTPKGYKYLNDLETVEL